MSTRVLTCVRDVMVTSVLLAACASDLHAQPGGKHLSGDITFISGQGIQPIFEGWAKNPDGSYELFFGYLNRNYVEELHVPVGPDNAVEPGGPDRGQPTYFYTRFNRRGFGVTVPRDFGKRELVWTVTLRGKTERAVGWLQPEWEIDDTVRGTATNRPPSLVLPEPGPVALPSPLTLTATVTDDGLPKPGKPRAGGTSENPPAFRPEGVGSAPVNVPQLTPPPRPRVNGLSVAWQVWRGPGAVAFEPVVAAVKDGKASVAAKFTVPGTYVLRARANDTSASAARDITVTVTDPRSPK